MRNPYNHDGFYFRVGVAHLRDDRRIHKESHPQMLYPPDLREYDRSPEVFMIG